MKEPVDQSGKPRLRWLRQYVIALALGVPIAIYGAIALLTRNTFLPGLRGGNSTLTGPHGVAMAVVYLVGGLFLVCRFFVDPRCRSKHARSEVYLVENILLAVLIGAAVYVLLRVGTAG